MPLPNNFCVAPFIQLQTSKDTCGPCPYQPNMWNVKGDIKDKWNSKELGNLRNSFLNNQKDTQCNRCWKEEDAGKESLRLRLRKFRGSANTDKAFEKFIELEQYKKYPRILTLIPGNECNLACASCSGTYSSKWNSLTSADSYGTFQKTMGNWNLSDEQYKDIVDNSTSLQKIELFGGEPFLNKKNKLKLIQKLVDKGTAKDIVLYFNTNGTVYDPSYMEYLSNNFKYIEIRQSIDGLHKEFEYLRYGANFDDVIKNAEKFASLPNCNFEVICTVSIFNVLTLVEFDEFMFRKQWSVFYNIASWPDYLFLHNLPEQVKSKIKLPYKFRDIEKYINLESCETNSWKGFVEYTKILDKNRNLSFKNTFPALYELVKKHGYE